MKTLTILLISLALMVSCVPVKTNIQQHNGAEKARGWITTGNIDANKLKIIGRQPERSSKFGKARSATDL